jgi:acetoin utilization protein AcuB
MLVRDIMTRPVVAIGPDEPISDVIALMAQRRLRHFPVVDAGRLVGIVSDRDLRTVGADHPSARPGVRARDPVRALMSTPVWTASPLDPIDEAAALLRRRAIGAMPVLDEDELVGIVTASDFLDALVAMTGVEAGTTRIEVELPRDPGALASLLALVAEHGAEVASVLARREDDAVRFVLRLATIDVRAIAGALDQAGFDVVWPPLAAPRRSEAS